MSLADRLSRVIPSRSNRGCVTCEWLTTLTSRDRSSFDQWISEGYSVAQLWEICTSMEENPLPVSNTGLRHHIRHHRIADES